MKAQYVTDIPLYLWLTFISFGEFQFGMAQNCRPQEYRLMSSNQAINISSPFYPNRYPAGSSCRYRVMAPPDHVVVLNCQFEVYPSVCETEYFIVSRDGDFRFRDAQSYCTTNQFQLISHFTAISFAYLSRSATTRLHGRFHCQAFARPQRCLCGRSLALKITNGQETRINEFPSMVALRDITSSQRIFCGGSILTDRYILTAAHCLSAQSNVRRIRATVGDHDLTNSDESAFTAEYLIQQAIRHPGYRPTAEDVANDLALLVTTMPIQWSRGVGPICLPFRQSMESFTYTPVAVVGWGTIRFAGSKSNTLQKAQLLTLDNAVCERQYNGSIAQSQICTYDYRGLGQDSCQYDSGGPVIFRHQQGLTLLGVISYGRNCGQRYGIGVNARITAHLNWLWAYVGGSICAGA